MTTQDTLARFSEADLRGAIRRNELILHYQPIVSAQTGRPVCVEALVRWRLASGEIVMPNDFIAMAEESDVIIELGEWVLRRACIDGLRWPGIRIAVNMSPVQLQNADFVQSVRDILRETGLPPEQLELELTERSALQRRGAGGSRHDCAAQVRRAHRARRFRHGLFGPHLSAPPPARQDQDRPRIPRCARRERRRRRARALDGAPRAAISA